MVSPVLMPRGLCARSRLTIRRPPVSSDRHTYMVCSELVTFLIYAGSMVVLPEYFGKRDRSLQQTE